MKISRKIEREKETVLTDWRTDAQYVRKNNTCARTQVTWLEILWEAKKDDGIDILNSEVRSGKR